MNQSTRLADLLQSTSGLYRARVTCLAALVIALFKVRTVNLAQLAAAFPVPVDIDSHYRPCNASSNTFNSNPLAWPPSCSLFYPMPPTPWPWTEPSGCLQGYRSTSSSCPSSITA